MWGSPPVCKGSLSMVLKLSDGTLFQSKALIGENVCESSSGSRVEVLDPATSQVLGTVPEMDSTDTQVAISEAAKALPISVSYTHLRAHET